MTRIDWALMTLLLIAIIGMFEVAWQTHKDFAQTLSRNTSTVNRIWPPR